mgnify:CR=1 FL=1|jgi:hypothetical protein|tara:strand:+ start:327 stop:575 length:249 start_codon:yes stop_codon:yes gene_type:complete
MTWFIVVLFAMSPTEVDRDMYIFTTPTYENETACNADITDPMVYPNLIQKLVFEYKKPKKIEHVICVEQKQLEKALNGEIAT